MSKDVTIFCITGKLKNGYLTVQEHKALMEQDVIELIEPESIETEDVGLVYYKYEDRVYINKLLIETDCFGNTGIVYYFKNGDSENVTTESIRINDLIKITQEFINIDIDELDIKVHSFTYYNGVDCPMEF